MKSGLLLFCMVWLQCVYAQNVHKNKLAHQVAIGVNYVDFLSSNKKLNSFSGNYSLFYSAIYKNKHVFKLSLNSISSNLSYPSTPKTGLIGLSYLSLNVGYAYVLPINFIHVLIGGFIGYRYGSEATVYAYRDPTSLLSEPLEARLNYNSLGFTPHVGVEYFFTKHVGIGCDFNLIYYPFEHSKLHGDGTNEPDSRYIQLYQANNLNVTIAFKMVYKFGG